jgi:hypothetical protein
MRACPRVCTHASSQRSRHQPALLDLRLAPCTPPLCPQVLGASDLEMLVWVCSKVAPAQLCGASPGPSQIILASLVQQLGYDLTKDAALKLPWLQETLQHLQPDDPMIKPSIHRILHSIVENMRTCSAVLGQSIHPQHHQFQQIANLLHGKLAQAQ